ncbi:hypothetical protein FLK61_38340 [Paenalkalicoccus suaedae]|uniref:Uncharacterized protein n=1 Tax=Paenalkalicoccus suaedae TaxID=2592382 RepID=A0A859FI18_9BACI|nr:hypothetical protein [Paenalkalicoccus suaedae]QKS72488.1 hypothetical protein FLK61_38340 [Paenalkalicoccus suaedae]
MSKKWMAGSVALFLPLVACSSPEEDIEALGEEYDISYSPVGESTDLGEDAPVLTYEEVEELFATLRMSIDDGSVDPENFGVTTTPELREPVSASDSSGAHTASIEEFYEGEETTYFGRHVSFVYEIEDPEGDFTAENIELSDISSYPSSRGMSLEWTENVLAEFYNEESGEIIFHASGEWFAHFIYDDQEYTVLELDAWEIPLDLEELLPS